MADLKPFVVTMGTMIMVEDALALDPKALKEKLLSTLKLENLTLLNVTEIKEATYEVVSEDKTGESKVPGDTHRGPQPDNGVGSAGKQEGSEDRKEVQGHEQGSGERNDPGQAGAAGKAS